MPANYTDFTGAPGGGQQQGLGQQGGMDPELMSLLHPLIMERMKSQGLIDDQQWAQIQPELQSRQSQTPNFAGQQQQLGQDYLGGVGQAQQASQQPYKATTGDALLGALPMLLGGAGALAGNRDLANVGRLGIGYGGARVENDRSNKDQALQQSLAQLQNQYQVGQGGISAAQGDYQRQTDQQRYNDKMAQWALGDDRSRQRALGSGPAPKEPLTHTPEQVTNAAEEDFDANRRGFVDKMQGRMVARGNEPLDAKRMTPEHISGMLQGGELNDVIPYGDAKLGEKEMLGRGWAYESGWNPFAKSGDYTRPDSVLAPAADSTVGPNAPYDPSNKEAWIQERQQDPGFQQQLLESGNLASEMRGRPQSPMAVPPQQPQQGQPGNQIQQLQEDLQAGRISQEIYDQWVLYLGGGQ